MSCSVCAGHDSSNCPCCGESYSIVKCPECGGDGIDHRLAFDIRTREEIAIEPLTYLALPKDEDDAEAKRWNYCRSDKNCPFCKGIGEVYQDIKNNHYPLY